MVQDMRSNSYSNVRYIYNLLPLNSMHELSPIGVRADIRAHAGTKCDLGRVDESMWDALATIFVDYEVCTQSRLNKPDKLSGY
jgi:hypothetical protein